jgi:hypothetical protein
MRQQSKESIVVLFVVGALALNYPFLNLFDRAWMPFGIPLLYLYLYLLWSAMIVLLIVIVEHSHLPPLEQEQEQPPTPPPENAFHPETEVAGRDDSGETHQRDRPEC